MTIRHLCNKTTCAGCRTCADPGPKGECRVCTAPDAGPCSRCGGTLVAVVEGTTTFLVHRDRACAASQTFTAVDAQPDASLIEPSAPEVTP